MIRFTTISILWTMFLLPGLSARGQIITTYAGGGTSVAEGVPATATWLLFPTAFATNSAGDLLVCEANHAKIRKVSTIGTVSSVAGLGTIGFSGDAGAATAAELSDPYAIAIDRIGNLFIADNGNRRIRKVDTFGTISTVAGNGALGTYGDGGPATDAAIGDFLNLAVDSTSNIYFGIATSVRKVSTSGIITTVVGGMGGYGGDGGPASAAALNTVTDVCFDASGNMYIADKNNNRIRKVNSAGIISTIAGNGSGSYTGDGGAATNASFSLITGVFVDASGLVYISDFGRVRRVDTNGIITTIAGNGTYGFGGDGGPATAAVFNVDYRVFRHGGGNLFIADRNNNRVRMIIDSNHVVRFVAGHSAHLNICTELPVNIDTLLEATDADTAQTIVWSLVSGPSHGSVAVSYYTTATGGLLLPSGLVFNPSGYVGLDTFRVRVSDKFSSDTITVYVRTDAGLPVVGPLIGPDTVCRGDTIVLTDSIAGGAWAATNSKASVVGGSVTGNTAGADTITYTVTNACGPTVVRHAVVIKICPNGLPESLFAEAALHIAPNPGKGTFVISLTEAIDEPVHIAVTDLTGRVIGNKDVRTNEQAAIDLKVSPGIYLVTAVSGHGVWVKRLVVE